jgi:hypothetical protein
VDRRMYRSNMRSPGYDRGPSPYRGGRPVCDDVPDYKHDDECDKRNNCFDDDRSRECFPIGMCYVPWQKFRDLYDNEFAALANGTLFKELDYDWYGRGC